MERARPLEVYRRRLVATTGLRTEFITPFLLDLSVDFKLGIKRRAPYVLPYWSSSLGLRCPDRAPLLQRG